MKHDPDKHHRRSIRLKGYDYSEAGAYFVTICAQGRECLFGDVVDGEMRLDDAGKMVQDVWNDLPTRYPDVETDEFVVMPNHFHGIIVIVGAGPCACPGIHDRPEFRTAQPQTGQPQGVAPTVLSLPDVVHRFKSFTTAEYRNGIRQKNWPPFNGTLWQRNYYEHIIRSEEKMDRIREYIIVNPMRWADDEDNPANIIHRRGDLSAHRRIRRGERTAPATFSKVTK
jgi:putative transposase